MYKLLGLGIHAEIAERIANMLRGHGHTAVGLAVTDDSSSDAEFVKALRSDSWDGVMVGSGTKHNNNYPGRCKAFALKGLLLGP